MTNYDQMYNWKTLARNLNGTILSNVNTVICTRAALAQSKEKSHDRGEVYLVDTYQRLTKAESAFDRTERQRLES